MLKLLIYGTVVGLIVVLFIFALSWLRGREEAEDEDQPQERESTIISWLKANWFVLTMLGLLLFTGYHIITFLGGLMTEESKRATETVKQLRDEWEIARGIKKPEDFVDPSKALDREGLRDYLRKCYESAEPQGWTLLNNSIPQAQTSGQQGWELLPFSGTYLTGKLVIKSVTAEPDHSIRLGNKILNLIDSQGGSSSCGRFAQADLGGRDSFFINILFEGTLPPGEEKTLYQAECLPDQPVNAEVIHMEYRINPPPDGVEPPAEPGESLVRTVAWRRTSWLDRTSDFAPVEVKGIVLPPLKIKDKEIGWDATICLLPPMAEDSRLLTSFGLRRKPNSMTAVEVPTIEPNELLVKPVKVEVVGANNTLIHSQTLSQTRLELHSEKMRGLAGGEQLVVTAGIPLTIHLAMQVRPREKRP